MDTQTWNREGYAKHGLTRETVEKVHSTTLHDGKIYQGEQGRQIRKKLLQKQTYYERNRSR